MTTLRIQIKPLLLLVMLAALAASSCNLHRPALESGVYIPNPEKQLEPLLVHEVQSMHAPSADTTYQIINPSNNPCFIIFEGASCGCTSVEVDDKKLKYKDRFTIAAGRSARLKIMSRLPAKPETVGFRATLTAVTADGTQQELSAYYSVNVLADLVFTPDVLSHEFHSLGEETVLKTIHVERRWRGPEIPSFKPMLGHLPPQMKLLQIVEDKPPEQIEPGIWARSWKLTVSVRPTSDLQSNPIRSMIAVMCTRAPNDDAISADLPILIRLASGIEAPKLCHFGSVQLGEKRVRRILLRAADNIEFSALKARSTSPAFLISKLSSMPGRSCWLELTFQPTKAGSQRGDIVIETDHPKNRQVTITVRGKGFEQKK